MYYILWKWGLWKVKVSIMMKAGDKMITCGTSPSSHTEKVKMAVFESESDDNRKWKQLLTYGTSHTLHLWAYSPESNSFLSEFDTFLYFFMIFSWYHRSPCLPPCIHTSLLSSCSRGIWRSPGKKDSKTVLLFWWIRSFQVWSYWFQIQNALAFTFPILNEMCVNINHSSNSRSLAAASLILPFIW